MKYFPYDLISAANGWGEETEAQQRAATRRFEHRAIAYNRHLDRARPNVSAAVWSFFRHGNPENTLHDARLFSLSVGDVPARPLGWSSTGRRRFATKVRLEFLTYAEDRLYVFDCVGIHRMETDLVMARGKKELGDLYIYELRVSLKGRLAVGFLFETGSTIDLECERLALRVQPTSS